MASGRGWGGQCMSCGSEAHDFRHCPQAPQRPTARSAKPAFPAAQPPPHLPSLTKPKSGEEEDWGKAASIPIPGGRPGNFRGGEEPGMRNGVNRGGGGGGGGGNFGSSGGGGGGGEGGVQPRGPRRGAARGGHGEDEDGPSGPPPSTFIPKLAGEEDLMAEEPSVTGLHFEAMDANEVEYTGPELPSVLEERDPSKWGVHPIVSKNVKRLGWLEATPIQRYAFKPIYEKRDVMGCAQTGSGKTGAYLIPVFSALLTRVQTPSLPDHCEPLVLIVVPTRELAKQIYEQASHLALGTVINCRVLYGGTSTRWAADHLRNTDLVVATAGRLTHFISEGTVELRRLKFLILDEADMMLSMGFESDIRALCNLPDMPPSGLRQTLMFSATFPPEIQRLAADFLQRHVFITIGIVGNANTAIEQSFHCLSAQNEKKRKLFQILREVLGEPNPTHPGRGLRPLRVLVFVERKRMADFLGSYMCEMGFPTATIHGDREQSQREEALRQLHSLQAQILIATSLAARGLHIPGIHLVVNYDLPQSIQEYVHRIGRTGRVGHEGRAISFYVPDFDRVMAPDLLRILEQSHQTVPDFLLNEARQVHTSEPEKGEFF